MKDDQRKGEGLRSDDGDGDGGLSFLLGLVFFSIAVIIISFSSVWVWVNPRLMGHVDDGDGERRGGSNH